MTSIRIHTSYITPRLEYACHILFNIIWQIPYSLHVFDGLPQEGKDINIYYGIEPDETKSTGNFYIQTCGLVFQSKILEMDLPCIWQGEIPILFPNDRECQLGFDIFSAVFFMVSRYEEYLPFTPDRFGRFPEVKSMSGQYDFTHLPVVHIWADLLASKFRAFHQNFQVKKNKPRALFTYDIDVAFAFKGRSLKIHALSLAKDIVKGRWRNLKLKLQSGFGRRWDPFDTYDTLISNNLPKLYFFLLSRKRNRYNRNIDPIGPEMKKLVERLVIQNEQAGIHPSYLSIENPGLINEEKEMLESLSGRKVIQSRQHYIRFKTPETFRELLNAGILQDHSMMYPEMPGFRAGICMPYPFFDVKENRMTNLMMHPACIMESTFRDDLFIPAHHTLEWYLALWDQVKKYGGVFITVWHNDTLQRYASGDHPLAFHEVHEKLGQIIIKDLEEYQIE